MGFRASRVRWPEWVIGAGGVVLLAAMLLMPWYTLTLISGPPGPKFSVANQVDGWHGLPGVHWLLLVTVALALAGILFQAQRHAPAVPVTLCLLASIFGGLTALWLIVRVPIAPPGGREIGGWIGLLGAAAIAYGGFRSVRLEGINPADGPAEIPTAKLAGENR
jgi:hypothetical protein